MRPDGDLDFLLIKGACNAGELARLGRNALPRGVPLDVIAAPPDYLAEKGASLSSLLRTAIEGTTLFADRQRLPYRPNAAAARAHEAPAAEPPPPNARPHQPGEAGSWLKHWGARTPLRGPCRRTARSRRSPSGGSPSPRRRGTRSRTSSRSRLMLLELPVPIGFVVGSVQNRLAFVLRNVRMTADRLKHTGGWKRPECRRALAVGGYEARPRRARRRRPRQPRADGPRARGRGGQAADAQRRRVLQGGVLHRDHQVGKQRLAHRLRQADGEPPQRGDAPPDARGARGAAGRAADRRRAPSPGAACTSTWAAATSTSPTAWGTTSGRTARRTSRSATRAPTTWSTRTARRARTRPG